MSNNGKDGMFWDNHDLDVIALQKILEIIPSL